MGSLNAQGPPGRRRSLLWCGLLAACTTTGPSGTPTVETPGELGHGEFVYACVESSDPVCRGDDTRPPFPDCVALGGEFELEYEVFEGPDAQVSSLSEEYFQVVASSRFRAARVGTAAMLARRADETVDYLHMRIVEPDTIEIRNALTGSPADTVLMRTGAKAIFELIPISGDCDPIGGSLNFTASSSDPSVVTASSEGTLALTARAPGEATISVEAIGMLHTFDVVVSDPPTRWPPGETETDTGTGSDGDTDSDSDASGSDSDATGTTGMDSDTTVDTDATDTDTDTDTGTTGTT
ncbi:MAG: hypothetical protein H6713_06350 [Myxococcales bacterium]|nr:hypothetical protein [Myxococcales bacterium]